MADPSHVIDHESLPLLEETSYEEKPTEILAKEVRSLRNKYITLVKVLWRNQPREEVT